MNISKYNIDFEFVSVHLFEIIVKTKYVSLSRDSFSNSFLILSRAFEPCN